MQEYKVLIVPKEPRSINGEVIHIRSHVTRETAYKAAYVFIQARYPNDQDLVNELCGEESPLGAFAGALCHHVIVAVDVHDYLLITPV